MGVEIRMGFHIVSRIRKQLILLGIVTVMLVLSRAGEIPSPECLARYLEGYFETYGLPLVAITSFLENLVVVNIYFPGSMLVLAAMALTAGNPTRAVLTYLAIVLPAIISQHVNFLLGRSSRGRRPTADREYREGPERLAGMRNWLVFFSTLWHPQLASVTCFAFGSSGISYRAFARYLYISGLAWSIFWGLLIYHVGNVLRPTQNLIPLLYVYLILWLLWDIRSVQKRS